jgi:TolB-like protein
MSLFSRVRPVQAEFLSGLCALAFVGGYLTGQSVLPGGVTPKATPIAEPGLAVLPFDIRSEEPGDDAFSSTLMHEIVAMLRQEGVRVAPSAAVERFKGQVVRREEVEREIPHIAGTLGAAAVVLGSVTRDAGGALLVSIHVFDGERGELLSEIGVNWQGPRTGRRILGEHVVPQIVQTLNRLS